jgi:intracellular sulfur oxidation DsrE/DsrF family protein
MKLKIILPLVCLLFLSITAVNAQQPGTADRAHKVVIQLTSGDTLAWKGVLKNITHLYETWGDNVQIEVVAHGHGVEFLVTGKTTQEVRIGELAKKGVQFRACENSLKDRKLTKQDVIGSAGTVPSGVVEVVMKEEEGWSYLKAGF